MKKLWQDPAYRKKQTEAIRLKKEDPKVKKKMLAAIKRKWQDPVYRAKMIRMSSKLMKSRKQKRLIAEGQRKRWLTPEAHVKARLARAKQMANPVFYANWRKACAKANKDPKARKLRSKIMKKKFRDHPEIIQKMSDYAKENTCWRRYGLGHSENPPTERYFMRLFKDFEHNVRLLTHNKDEYGSWFFTADFLRGNLVVELDGGRHLKDPVVKDRDERKAMFLEDNNYHLSRIPNSDMMLVKNRTDLDRAIVKFKVF